MRGRPSIIYETWTRLDRLKATGVSRYALKKRVASAARAAGAHPRLAVSTGLIHADTSRETYRNIALRYVQWARSTHGIKRLVDLDSEADRFVCLYLQARSAAGDRAATLKTIRSALRLLHGPAFDPDERAARVRALGASVALPVRRREDITRSRRPVAMDGNISLERYRAIIAFAEATGLRRRELEAVTVRDVRAGRAGTVMILVRNGKGGRVRSAPVVQGRENDVLQVIIGRAPDERIFPRIPTRIDVGSLRRRYAELLYCENGTRLLPPPEGRLPRGCVDTARAAFVAQALGHSPSRTSTVLRHYLR